MPNRAELCDIAFRIQEFCQMRCVNIDKCRFDIFIYACMYNSHIAFIKTTFFNTVKKID